MHCEQDYESNKAVIIHYPPSQYLDDSARRSVLADLPGLRLAKNVQLQREERSREKLRHASTLNFGGNCQRLLLRIHNKVILLTCLVAVSSIWATSSPRMMVLCIRWLRTECWCMQMHAHSRARQVTLSAPFWVINKTNLELEAADTTPNGGLPVTCRPGLHDAAAAVPFRCGPCSDTLSVCSAAVSPVATQASHCPG